MKFQAGLKFLSEFQMEVLINIQKNANVTIQDINLTVKRGMTLKEFILKYVGAKLVLQGR